jgi:hypothetical protein
MIRKEISLFLKNVPGELGILASMLKDENINIDALAIQDASAYVSELFNARGKSLKRIASTESYDSIRRDSNEYALIRFLVSDVERTVELMSHSDYIFDINPVITVHLENKPGALAEVTSTLGAEKINISYVYVTTGGLCEECVTVVGTDEIDRAAAVLGCQ